MRHVITGIAEGSIAQAQGLLVDDILLQINGEDVRDVIDYQALTAHAHLTVTIERGGRQKTIAIDKEDWESLGLTFADSMKLSPRPCRNKCVFCFIDQMPPNLRKSLYVKDDDWRFSLMMGNYITLTNVDDAEFQRIIERKASPLYVSVHTTNPQLRRQMMHNQSAGEILPRLTRLKEAGIRFHCQIVCCPGINDGEELLRTLEDLASLAPAALSVAVVPVGITKFRHHLPKLEIFDAASAKALLFMLEPFQAQCRKKLHTSFAFASDEFYCLSGEPVPPASWYEGYPQIENGVGLLRQLEEQLRESAEDDTDSVSSQPMRYIIVTGVAAAAHMHQLLKTYTPDHIDVQVAVIINHFFGETVTVAGLLTGEDIISQLSPALLQKADQLLLPANMLNHDRDVFLDDMPFEAFQARLPLPVRVIDDGYDLYNALRNR